MALKKLHNEIIKSIGYGVEDVKDLYNKVSKLDKFSELRVNQFNFNEALDKLVRLEYVDYMPGTKLSKVTLKDKGVIILLKRDTKKGWTNV